MASHHVPHTKVPTLVFPTCPGGAARRADDREPDSSEQLRRPAHRPRPAHRLDAGGLYRELIRLHNEAGLDFARVVTFNLDEYYPDAAGRPAKLPAAGCRRPFSTTSTSRRRTSTFPTAPCRPDDVERYLRRYEQQIRRAGGIDLQLLGIGRNGHIGFNEPGSTRHSRTRLVTLDPVTRRDAASGFFGEENVPHQALTMGVGTILEARKIVLMALGEHKAAIVRGPSKGR